jgi:hypothetical protein
VDTAERLILGNFEHCTVIKYRLPPTMSASSYSPKTSRVERSVPLRIVGSSENGLKGLPFTWMDVLTRDDRCKIYQHLFLGLGKGVTTHSIDFEGPSGQLRTDPLHRSKSSPPWPPRIGRKTEQEYSFRNRSFRGYQPNIHHRSISLDVPRPLNRLVCSPSLRG